MNKLAAIAQAVVADAVRRKVVWVVVVFAGLLAIAIPALPSYGVGIIDGVFKQVAIALMWVAAIIVALSLAATRVPVEVERRTVFNIVSRDVRRWQYVVGTWLGMFLTLGVVLLAFAVATIAIGWFTYGHPMFILLEAAFATWLEIGIIMAFTVMLSTLFGPVTSVVGGLAHRFRRPCRREFPAPARDAARSDLVPVARHLQRHQPGGARQRRLAGYLIAMLVLFVGYVTLFMTIGSFMFAGRDL